MCCAACPDIVQLRPSPPVTSCSSHVTGAGPVLIMAGARLHAPHPTLLQQAGWRGCNGACFEKKQYGACNTCASSRRQQHLWPAGVSSPLVVSRTYSSSVANKQATTRWSAGGDSAFSQVSRAASQLTTTAACSRSNLQVAVVRNFRSCPRPSMCLAHHVTVCCCCG